MFRRGETAWTVAFEDADGVGQMEQVPDAIKVAVE